MALGGKTTGQPHAFALLDGLRGLGAVLILVGHTLPFWGPFLAPSGAVVVDLFFVLSGFVIAFSYEPKFAAGMGAAEFMIQRVVRLYPLYILGTLIGFVVLGAMSLDNSDAGERGRTLTLSLLPQLFILPAPAWLDHNAYPLNVPAWTLFFEFAVNLVYVLIYRWLSMRVLMLIVAVAAAGLAFTVFHFGGIDAGSDWPSFWAGFSRAGFGFFAGVLGFRLVGSPRTSARPQSNWALVLLVVLPVACFVPSTRELRPFVDLMMAVVMGLPLLWLCQSIAPPSRFVGIMTIGGRISYAIYILQQPFREILKRVDWRYPEIYSYAPLPGIAALILVVGFAYFAERYYDRPVRRFIVAKLKARATRRHSAEAPMPMVHAE